LAERIIERRESAGVGGTFTSMSQVEAVPGVGADTLHDLIYSFYEAASKFTDSHWLWVGPFHSPLKSRHGS
jgi:hypothetical protein